MSLSPRQLSALKREIKRLQNHNRNFMTGGNVPPLSRQNMTRLGNARRTYNTYKKYTHNYWKPGGLGHMKLLLKNTKFNRRKPSRTRTAPRGRRSISSVIRIQSA